VTLEGADDVTLIRNQDGKSQRTRIDTQSLFQDGQVDLNHQVMGGDVIFVPRAAVFYIYGEVQKPGAFRLEKNMNVMQALSLGGGITQRGTQKGIQIRRQGEQGQPVVLKAALTDPVQAGDVVYVKESLF
jgi:polysaccharide export outer membrane protein